MLKVLLRAVHDVRAHHQSCKETADERLTLRDWAACACLRNCCFCLFGHLEALQTELLSRGAGMDTAPTACCQCGTPSCVLACGSICTAQEAAQAGPFLVDKSSFFPLNFTSLALRVSPRRPEMLSLPGGLEPQVISHRCQAAAPGNGIDEGIVALTPQLSQHGQPELGALWLGHVWGQCGGWGS